MIYEGAEKLFDSTAFSAASGEALHYSIGYIPGTRTLLQQTCDYDGVTDNITHDGPVGAGRWYLTQGLDDPSKTRVAYTRRTREIDAAGNVSNLMHQDARPFLNEYGDGEGPSATLTFKVFNCRNSPYIQAVQTSGEGVGAGASGWIVAGLRGQNVVPAHGSDHHAAVGYDEYGMMYSGTGVYVFQGGIDGPTTSTGIAFYPGSYSGGAQGVAQAFAQTDDEIGLAEGQKLMIGYDRDFNIYAFRRTTTGGMRNRIISYTPDLSSKRFEIDLGTEVPVVGGAIDPTSALVINDGRLLTISADPAPGTWDELVHVYDISDPENLTYLGAFDTAPLVPPGNPYCWSTAECEVFYRGGNTLWQVGDCLGELLCTDVGVDQIVYDLARRAGIPSSRIDVSALAPSSDFPSVWGMGVGRPASARQLTELLQAYSFFDMTEQGGIIVASRRDRDPSGTIGLEDLRAHAYGEEPPSLAERERTEDYEIPRETRVQYLQALAEYEPGVEAYARRVTDAEGVVDIDLSSIAMEPDRAALIAEATMLEAITAREAISFHLTGTEANKALRASDIKTLSVNDRTDVVRLVEIDYAFPGLLRVKSLRHDPTVYASDAQGVGRRAIGSIIINPGPTDLALLDAPLVREHDEAPGYFAAMGGNPTIPGIMEGWPGGNLERLEPGGWEQIAQALRPGCQVGTATTVLADADVAVIDPQELRVTVPGFLLPATLQEACLGANLAAVEVLDGGEHAGWELIRFLDAEFDTALGEWRLTNLIRGVHGTEWATALHGFGERFVFLGGEVQVLTDIDTELELSRLHNAATIGSTSTASLEQAFAWSGVDRKPYAPAHVHGERDTDDDILLDWTRRDRVGMELQSGQTLPLSEDAEEYEVDIIGEDSDGAIVLRTLSVSTPEATYTAAQQTTDFGSLPGTITVSVYQIGALGRGYPATVTLTID